MAERDYVVVQEGAIAPVVKSEWREVSLGECTVINDSTYSPKDAWPIINYLDTGNIFENRISEIQALEAGKDKIPSRARRKVEPGDIVYSTVRPNQRHFGLLKSIPENFLASTGFAVLRGKEGIADTGFLYWFLAQDHVVDYLHSIGENSTSAYPSIRPSDLEELVLSLPPLSTQRAIAHVLGTLDDKIELNRRMNETLEGMARAIFQDWFVDFGPVRAKMEGREPYLPPEVWSLFPDRLVDSELGDIPEGWEVKAFGTLLDDVIGGDWGKESPSLDHTEPVSIIRGTDLSALAEGGSGAVPLRFTTKKKAERRMLKDGDIIIEVSGGSRTQSTGRCLMITRDVLRRFPGTVVCASFCRRFRPNSWRDGLLALRHLDFLYSTGKMWDYQLQSTGIANFQTTLFLKEEMVIWPGESLLTKFAEIVDPIVRQTARNEIMILAAQRDALLPRLVSGEVGVGLTESEVQ